MTQSKFIDLYVNRLAPTKTLLLVLMLSLTTANLTSAQTEFDIKAGSDQLEREYREELDKWMLRAYEGDPDAQFKVGVLFTNQQFDSTDYEQAVYWYTQAARQGHVLAQYNLGHQYLTGVGVRKSEKSAMEWWLKAADQDHALAQFNIGRAYYLGIGVKEDHAQSKVWFNRAAQNQEPKSIEILTQLGWNDQAKGVENSLNTTNPIKKPSVASSDPLISEALVSKLVPADIKPPSPPVVDIVESSQSQPSPTTTGAKPTLPSPITLYTNPGVRSVLIGIVDERNTLKIVERGKEWHTVTSSAGFPVWVHADFLDVKGRDKTQGLITGNGVNARSVPIVTHGTVVGRLNRGEKVTILEKSKGWFRIIAPKRFKAWVRAEDFERQSFIVAKRPPTEPAKKSPKTQKPKIKASQPTVVATNRSSTTTSLNDNQWLYRQPDEYYTLQLASFDDIQKVAVFIADNGLGQDPQLHRFSSKGKGIEWTYFLYGSYASKQAANAAKLKLGQKKAWVRTVSRLQQNRCLAWKKQLPPPPELNKYCGA